MLSDLRFALRLLRRNPAFTIVSVIVLRVDFEQIRQHHSGIEDVAVAANGPRSRGPVLPAPNQSHLPPGKPRASTRSSRASGVGLRVAATGWPGAPRRPAIRWWHCDASERTSHQPEAGSRKPDT